MPDIFYVYEDNLYVNLTNQCPCACDFCIRTQTDHLGTAKNLWLNNDPSFEDIIAALQNYNLNDYSELIFCGYGEPLSQLHNLLATCDYVKSKSKIKIRLNTNGLSDLINNKPTANMLANRIDIVSISLNAPNAQKYNLVCHPTFGDKAYPAILKFAEDCKKYIPEVIFTLVDVISSEEIDECKQISKKMDIPLRIRHFTDYAE